MHRGERARKIVFHPASGRVLMRHAPDPDVARPARGGRHQAARAPRAAGGDVELFT